MNFNENWNWRAFVTLRLQAQYIFQNDDDDDGGDDYDDDRDDYDGIRTHTLNDNYKYNVWRAIRGHTKTNVS